MRLTVFGATGAVGQEIVRQASAAGHEVTAVVRDPSRLPDGLRDASPHEVLPCPMSRRPSRGGMPCSPGWGPGAVRPAMSRSG